MSELLLLLFQDWMERAKQIQCPAPLPEEPVIPRLAKMLVPAPYKAPEKKAKKKAKGAKSGPRRKGASDATSKDEEAHSSVPEDNDGEEEEEENNPPLRRGRRRGRLWRIRRRKRPRRGRESQRSTPHGTLTAVRSDAPALSPRPHRK